jgi:kynurenine formamidase
VRPATPIEALDGRDVLAAASLIRTGRVYDLDCGRWHGMPVWGEHAPMQVLSYRTSSGLAVQGDQEWLAPGRNAVNFAWNSELLLGTMHTGTHIDALSHVTCGPDSHWFGGTTAREALGDFGPLTDDAAAIPPIVARGVLLDVAGAKRVRALPAGDPITRTDLARAQQAEIRRGDVVLVRTGYMSAWPDPERMAAHDGAGLTLDAAEAIADAGAVAIGADNESLEQEPSDIDGSPLPVHVELLVNRGVFILELVFLEQLAADGVHEFAFVCLPLKVRGATGSMVRPIAVV